MKVLLANSTCKVGGVSTFMLALRSALLSLGHECDLFFFERGTMEPHLPADARIHFGTLADCLRLVSRERIPVVHANNVDWSTGISAVRQAGARLILTAHKARDSAWTYGWTSANCDALVAVSHAVGDLLQPYTDLPIQVVQNGVDTTAFTPAERAVTSPPIVAWVGRSSSPLKRLDKLAAVAPALHAAGMRLWIIDQHGADKAALVAPEAVRILQPLVERWDGVSHDQMPEHYREVAASGGCVLSTSIREGLGLAILEAQACGCLAIGPDVAGINEAVSPTHGGTLYPFDMAADDVGRLILSMLADPDRVRQRQRLAAEHVKSNFSLERMAASYLRIYKDAPFAAAGPLGARVRGRLRLSPLVDWKGYLEQRWGVGHRQYQASSELLAAGDQPLAAAAARASFKTTPTLALHPQRLAYLLRHFTS